MSPDQRFRATYFVLLSKGIDPSVRTMLVEYRHIYGKGVRQEPVRLWLAAKRDTFGTNREHAADTPSVLLRTASGHTADTRRTPSRARHKVLDSQGSLLSPNGESPAPTTAKKRREPKPPVDWIVPLEAELEPMFVPTADRDDGLELRDLTPEQRLVLGRVHALRFAGCRASEAKNRTRGAQIASGIASMATDASVHNLSVREYLKAALRTYEMRGRPFFKAWDVRAAIPASRMESAREAKYEHRRVG